MAVRKNSAFLLIVSMTAVLWFFMTQWMSVLPLYVINDLNLDLAVPSLLFSINALMVVALQLWVTSHMVRFRRSLVLMMGQLIISAGFALIFFGTDLYSLIACIVLITVGEIVYMSIISAIIADLAPEAERGIYMGFAGVIQSLGMGVGLLFGMWLLDVFPQDKYLWPIFGAIGALTSVGYLIFARVIGPEKDHPSKYATPVPIKTVPIEKT
jgi:MFS family permease